MKKVGLGSVLWAAVVLIGIIWYMGSNSGDPSPSVQVANAATIAPASSALAMPVDFSDPHHYEKNQDVPKGLCKESLACMADKQLGWTEASCKEAIEAQSKYQVKWTDGMLHPLLGLPIAHWQSPTDSEVAYVGDRLEVQNQFGAFERMNYRCVWDTRSQKVVSVEIQPTSM